MERMFLSFNGYQNVIVVERDVLENDFSLNILIDGVLIKQTVFSLLEQSPLLNINQIHNAGFELGTKCWDVLEKERTDFSFGVDSSEEWVLEQGHTAYLLQNDLDQKSLELIYSDPILGEFLPVKEGEFYQIGGSFACHRCDAGFIVEFFNSQQQKIQQQKFDIFLESDKTGGKFLEDYSSLKEMVCVPSGAISVRLVILKLPTVKKAKEINSLLFFTQLFFVQVSTEHLKFLDWQKCPVKIKDWEELKIKGADKYVSLTFEFPDSLYDGEEHHIEINNDSNNNFSLVDASKYFKLTDQEHKDIIVTLDKSLKDKKQRAVNKIQNILNQIARSRFECIIDGFSNTLKFEGWLSDNIYPKQIVTLELHENEKTIATTTTYQIHSKYGRGMFTFTFPESILDGCIHKFSLYIKEYAGYVGEWDFVTPEFELQSHFEFVENSIWKDMPLANRLINSNKQQKPLWFEKRVEKFEIDIFEADGIDIQYQLICKLGNFFLENKKPKDALENFLMAMRLEDDNPEAFIAYIKTLIILGKEKDAELAAQSALNIFPNEIKILELLDKLSASKRLKKSKIIAFYLPQFHPIPENDRWWGKGFTEWTNVAGAQPLFDGHLQPRRPAGLGYYDLRLPESANAQFDLARRYGIDGFCYYHYWFHGQRVLEKPLQDLVDGKTGPFPFCICWANEDWTRSWDGNTGEVLLAQEHSSESDLQFIKDLAPLLKHPDYIRVEGKAVVLVYRVDIMATPKETVQAWREWCREEGIGELHLCAVQSFDFDDPLPYGFDAAVEFPPHTANKKYPELAYRKPVETIEGLDEGFSGEIISYEEIAHAAMNRPREAYMLHRSCFLAWDNTARRGKKASIFHEFNISTYQNWLTDAAVKNTQEQKTGLTFINAWNEWAEGTTLEPDQFLGYEPLERTQQVKDLLPFMAQNVYWKHGKPLLHNDRVTESERIILVGHDAHFNGAQINLLNMCRCLHRELNMQLIIILINGGELLLEYEKLAPTLVVGNQEGWEDKLLNFVTPYSKLGTTKVICNTVVTGNIAKFFSGKNYRVINLVHELPTLIESYGLQGNCWNLAESANNIVFASKIVAEHFCSRYLLSVDKVVIAPQGIVLNPYHQQQQSSREEVREEFKLSPETLIVIGCGYADTRKGIDLFVQVASQVCSSLEQSVAFIWVGELENSIKPYILADIERLGLDDKVFITGKTKDSARYFIAGDVFALTSREDPFPSVVMEAFDAKMPVVAFDGGGGYVEIVNSDTGALVPYLDVNAMSKGIAHLLDDESHRRKIGEYTHTLCREQYAYVPYMRKLLALLNKIPAKQVEKGILKHQAWSEDSPRPTITAIVPNYNYGRYLELRLLTILEQTLPPNEIIILDDASSDYSIDLINKIVENSKIPIQVCINETNTGNPFVQWAKGIELAKGELIWIAEADDYCEPTLLETLAKEFIDESVNLAWADSVMVSDNGESSGFTYKKYYAENYGTFWNSNFKMSGNELIDKCLLVANVVPNASAALFRRKAAGNDLINIIKEYKFSGDWWFWISIAQTGNVVYYADALNYHRRHNNSVMGEVLTDSDKFLVESLSFFQRMVEHKPECLTANVKLQMLERLEGMYKMFPELVEAYPHFIDSPKFHEQYLSLFTELKPAQALLELHTKTPAILIISEDELKDVQLVLSLIQSLKNKHTLQLVLLIDEETEIENIELYKNKVLNTVIFDSKLKKEIPKKIIEEMSSMLPFSENEQIISFGLLAHIFIDSILDENTPEWKMIIGNKFDSLLGTLPRHSGVTIEGLKNALKNCYSAQFIGDKVSHVFENMAKEMFIPIEKFNLSAIKNNLFIDEEEGIETAIYFLGVATNTSVEIWHLVSELLQQIGENEDKQLILRILAWGETIEPLKKELDKHENVEIITIFEKPQDFSLLADIGFDFQEDLNDDLATLTLDFKQSRLPVVSFLNFEVANNREYQKQIVIILKNI